MRLTCAKWSRYRYVFQPYRGRAHELYQRGSGTCPILAWAWPILRNAPACSQARRGGYISLSQPGNKWGNHPRKSPSRIIFVSLRNRHFNIKSNAILPLCIGMLEIFCVKIIKINFFILLLGKSKVY